MYQKFQTQIKPLTMFKKVCESKCVMCAACVEKKNKTYMPPQLGSFSIFLYKKEFFFEKSLITYSYTCISYQISNAKTGCTSY